MNTSVLYLDHAAATPCDPRVLSAMRPYFDDVFYNPSSSYEGGRKARAALNDARHTIAHLLGAKPYEIIFTAGATESIHIALQGVLKHGGHAVIGATEHAAVRGAVAAYPFSVAAVDHRGLVTAESVRAVLREDTTVVSIALADSEFGTVQPIREIARMLEEERVRRRISGNPTPLYFHSDGSQAATALDVKVARLGVDMLTLNAAKCYGPKQVGLLWVRSSVRLAPFMDGGGQERGLRSGTENVAAIVGFASALELVQGGRYTENQRLLAIRQQIMERLQSAIPDIHIDGHPKRHLPGHIHLHIDRLDAERVVFRLDMQGVYIATGAACAANKDTRSPSLEAIGLTPSEADGSLRISLGHLTTDSDALVIAERLIDAIQQERLL